MVTKNNLSGFETRYKAWVIIDFVVVNIPIALQKLKESVLRGFVLQISLPVMTLLMRHKLCLSLCSSAVGVIPQPPLAKYSEDKKNRLANLGKELTHNLTWIHGNR